jgi:DNA-3-methyladenine glycosylase
MKLEWSFYERDTLTVAQDLLGCILVHQLPEGTTSGKIVETEAYLGTKDKAAHSYGGRHTPRMDPLYKRGGYAYIYQLHGYNYCINVVTEKKDLARAVLIRALEPVDGLELMAKRRRLDISSGKLKNLTNGPSKLCQALAIDTSLNGIDLGGDEVFISAGEDLKEEIAATPRINIDYAEEDKYNPWRFLIKGNDFVSRR